MTQPISSGQAYRLSLMHEIMVEQHNAQMWRVAKIISLIALVAIAAAALILSSVYFGVMVGVPYTTAGIALLAPWLSATSMPFHQREQSAHERCIELQGIQTQFDQHEMSEWIQRDINQFARWYQIACTQPLENAIPLIARFYYLEEEIQKKEDQANTELKQRSENPQLQSFFLNMGWNRIEREVIPLLFQAACLLQQIQEEKDYRDLLHAKNFHSMSFERRLSEQLFNNNDLYFHYEESNSSSHHNLQLHDLITVQNCVISKRPAELRKLLFPGV